MNRAGVINMDRATTNSNCSLSAVGNTCCCTVNPIKTNPNSPACAKDSVNSMRERPFMWNSNAMANKMAPLIAMTPRVIIKIVAGLPNKMSKLMPAPTVMKNSPNNNPLNGSMSLSNSWRNSEFAKTTPARNVPKAGDRPTIVIRYPMPTTIKRVIAVYISRKRAAWMKRNTSGIKKMPAKIMPAITPRVASVTAQPGRPSNKLVAACAASCAP